MVDMLGNDTWKVAGQLMEFTYTRRPTPQRLTEVTRSCAPKSAPYPLHGLEAGGLGRRDPPSALRRRNETMAGLSRVGGHGPHEYEWTPLDNWRLNRAASSARWWAETSARTMAARACPTGCRWTGSTCRTVLAGGPELDGGGVQRRPGSGRGRGCHAAGLVKARACEWYLDNLPGCWRRPAPAVRR